MAGTYLSFGEDTLFCRHNEIADHRASILLIHGLGDSGLAFAGIFEDERSKEFNVVIPDLLGYGRSSHSSTHNYSFKMHTDHLWKVMDNFGLEEITVVGHSMGGDLGTLLCQQEAQSLASEPGKARIVRFINVEGNLTAQDLFISGQAARAVSEGRFEEWFHWDFLYRQVCGVWCQRGSFGRIYLASLQFCDPHAFRQNALELYGRGGVEAGTLYGGISIDKLFVFGQRSLHPESRSFAFQNKIKGYEVIGSHHWPMLDCAGEFYDLLFRFSRGEEIECSFEEQATVEAYQKDALLRR